MRTIRKALWATALVLVAAGCARELEFNELSDNFIDGSEDNIPHSVTIHAGFERMGTPDTKTSLQMNGASADVLWKSGDAIRVMANKSGNTFYSNDFTTDADGVSSADFECSNWTPEGQVRKVYAFYPASSFMGLRLDSGYGLGVLFPSVQTAVDGNIDNGLNISYAIATALTDDFLFRNIPSLIKFRLNGDSVDELASIKFSASTNIVGEGMLMSLTSDSPYVLFSKYYGDLDEPAGNVVTLNKPADGSFKAGVDYYIAVAPSTTEGFSMIFSDADGNYVTKTSTKTLVLGRSVISDLGTITVDGLGDPLVKKYMKQTSGSPNPVDIAVIPDGFTAGQRSLFEQLAASAIDFMFDTEPYKSYKDYFNVYFIWAPSNQTGGSVTNGSGVVTQAHDTAFGTRWGSDSYNDMTADADKVFSYVSAHCPEIVKGTLTIRDVPVLIIVNDSRYGGICQFDPYGQAFCIAPYTFSGGGIRWEFMNRVPNTNNPVESNWNYSWHTRTSADISDEEAYNIGDWKNTVLHEYGGHAFGRLTDEYYYDEDRWYAYQGAFDEHSWPVPFALNVSGYYNTVPWQTILDKYNAGQLANPKPVGKFQGGAGSIYNVWRSEKTSCMINNNQYFSAWQRVLIAKRITEKAGETFNLDMYLAHEAANPVPYKNGDTRKGNQAVRTMPHLPHPVRLEGFTQTSVPLE